MHKKILLIEDEQLIADMYADTLEEEGFEVTIIGDGQAGLEAAQTGNYDLVLLDLMLPNVTGLEILKILRDPIISPNFTPDHRIIVLTNLNEDDIITKDILSLADGYYMKVNITPRKLAGIIKDMGSTSKTQSTVS